MACQKHSPLWNGVEKQITQWLWTDAADQGANELLAFSVRCAKRRWSTLKDKMKRSGLQQWVRNVKYRRRDPVAFSMEEQQCCSLFRKTSVSGERRFSPVGEPQLPVMGWEDPLTSFDCLRRRIEDISYENCSGIALNLQGLQLSCKHLNQMCLPVPCQTNGCVGGCSYQKNWFGEWEEKLIIRPGCRIWLTSKLM